jgi:hypothetical protein
MAAFNANLDNLSDFQQHLLCAHHWLGHLGFENIQTLAHAGFLPKHLTTCPKPICSSCQLGKAHQSAIPSVEMPLDSGHLQPWGCISVD